MPQQRSSTLYERERENRLNGTSGVKISHDDIMHTIETVREPLLESVQLFDFRFGDESNLGSARKSLAYRLTYRDRSRTLTSEEVNAAHAKIRERLRRDLGAELRE